MTSAAARNVSKKDKLISLEGVNLLLKECPPKVRPHEIPLGADGRPDNRTLFRHFFVRQVTLARLVARLRFPFANYLRNEISEAVVDRECNRLGPDQGAASLEAFRAETKALHFPRALETRHDLLGNHSDAQKNKERVRTQMLRHIHGAAMKAADLLDEIEAAAAASKKHPRLYRQAEDRLTMWIINSLSCFALMEMARLSSDESAVPAVEGEGAAAKQQRLALFKQFRAAADECTKWRNHIVRENMTLAYRHVEMQSISGDPGSRLSHAVDGLLQAVDRYNALLPAPFEGFAPDWIRQAIKRGHQQQGSLIALPINVQKNAQKVREFMDRCAARAGLQQDEISREMMLKGFHYRNVETGKKEFMDGVKDAADGRDISADALSKALASPIIRSIDAPINDHGDGEGDTYPQLPSGEADAAQASMDRERADRLCSVIDANTTPAERVVLGFMTKWNDPAIAASHYIQDLAAQSVRSTRSRLEARTSRPRQQYISKIVLLESYQPAAEAPQDHAKASGE